MDFVAGSSSSTWDCENRMNCWFWRHIVWCRPYRTHGIEHALLCVEAIHIIIGLYLFSIFKFHCNSMVNYSLSVIGIEPCTEGFHVSLVQSKFYGSLVNVHLWIFSAVYTWVMDISHPHFFGLFRYHLQRMIKIFVWFYRCNQHDPICLLKCTSNLGVTFMNNSAAGSPVV